MSENQTELHVLPIYKLLFDDIEEIFLHTISFRLLILLLIFTGIFSIGILFFLLTRKKDFFSRCLIPFLYALITYDFVQLLSLVLLKLNATEQYFNQFCRWAYYLKSCSEAGQCLTLVFLFVLIRYQLRHYHTHRQLPNTDRIHARALTLVCLLFIIYVNNWITHLKVERAHSVTLNTTKYDIHIQELSLSYYAHPDESHPSHQRFIADLEKYSQGYEKILGDHRQPKAKADVLQSHPDSSGPQIVIKFRYDQFFNPNQNRTKRRLRRQLRLNQSQAVENTSYRINRCTCGQSNFFLANFLSLIYSMLYFILIIYYIIIIYTYKIPLKTLDEHRQSMEKSLSLGRRKSADRHEQEIRLVHLKRFLRLIIFCHALLACLRLIYSCSLTFLLAFVALPMKWLPLKHIFYSLFLLSYYSIPVRMFLLFFFLFLNRYSFYLRSIFFYVFRTNLRVAWKFEKPRIRFRCRFIPYSVPFKGAEIMSNALTGGDVSSSIDDEPRASSSLARDSVLVLDPSQNKRTSQIRVLPVIRAHPSNSF